VIRYTRLAADGSDLPESATGHQAIRIERDILARPIIVANAMPPKAVPLSKLKQWAAGLTIYNWSWRIAHFEELIMVPDYERPECALDTGVFTEVDPDSWFISDTPYPRIAGYFRGVYLYDGDSGCLHQGSRNYALAVRAGQF
jgi:hypothetical protein